MQHFQSQHSSSTHFNSFSKTTEARKENSRSAQKLCKTPGRARNALAQTCSYTNYDLNQQLVSSIKESVITMTREAEERSPVRSAS